MIIVLLTAIGWCLVACALSAPVEAVTNFCQWNPHDESCKKEWEAAAARNAAEADKILLDLSTHFLDNIAFYILVVIIIYALVKSHKAQP